ncbi:MAG: acyltransferase [Deltaproteobacteria bacterium]|nr:acyltransferase [Deltaproteobacteria bacterium]
MRMVSGPTTTIKPKPMRSWMRLPIFNFGWTGVDLFLVLSGYLIGRQIWKELKSTKDLKVGRFLLRRGLRIWPLYFVVLAFLVLVFDRNNGDFSKIIPDLFFVSNYFPGVVSGGWSLSTEEQFYLVAPFLVLALSNILSFKKQRDIPIILLAALPVTRFFILRSGNNEMSNGVYTNFHTHCDGLVIGLLLAWFSVAKPENFKKQSFSANVWLPTAILFTGVVLRVFSPFHKDVFAFSSLAFIFGAMVLFTLRDGGLYQKLASWHGFYLISRLSYGMYLNHFEVLPRLVPALSHCLGSALGAGLALAVASYGLSILVSLGIAMLTFTLIEHPFLHFRDGWLKIKA